MYRALQELFAGNCDLFKGLWIEQSDWEWTKYPVIKLDMSAVAGRGSTEVFIDEIDSLCATTVSGRKATKASSWVVDDFWTKIKKIILNCKIFVKVVMR